MARSTDARTLEHLKQVMAHVEAGRLEQAMTLLRRTLQRAPMHPEGNNIAAFLHVQRQEHEQAVFYAERAANASPSNSAFRGNLGSMLLAGGKPEAAEAHLIAAIELDPGNAQALNGLAQLDQSRGQFEAAIEKLQRAIEMDPAQTEPRVNLGLLLVDTGRATEGVAALRAAAARDPMNHVIQDHVAYAINYDPEASAEDCLWEHTRYGQILESRPIKPVFTNEPNADRKLRIGYLTRDFRRHSIAYFLLPILERHDRSAVESYAYSLGTANDDMTEKLRAQTDVWRDASSLGDDALFKQIRADRIDVLVELHGHTTGHRYPMMAHRPAPVQVTYLAYPHTTGMKRVQYRVIDGVTDPTDESAQMTETPIRIEPSFLCYRPPAESPEPAESPPSTQNAGLTFGSFNDFKKMGSSVYDAWAGILTRVPNSRLLLKTRALEHEENTARCLSRFAERGIDSARLELVASIPSAAEHLALYRSIDLALDTFPYAGTTTTCEAMWMGVPTLTLHGDRHATRVGASLNRVVGLESLIAEDVPAYIERAVMLAENPGELAELRTGLRERVAASALCDEPGFVAKLESAYRDMWRAWCANPR